MFGQAAWTVAVVSAVAIAALAGVIVSLLYLQARDRRQIAALLERLEGLETDRADRTAVLGGVDAQAGSPPVATPADPDPTQGCPTGDVLHGRTTHVQRIIDGPPGTAMGLADQAIFRVHKHIEENLTPHQLAWELCVSLRTLERGLGLALACTPRQLILAMKMREARVLLAAGKRVGEVAQRLGFSNPFHFSRRFKDFYHVAPSEMRPGNPADR